MANPIALHPDAALPWRCSPPRAMLARRLYATVKDLCRSSARTAHTDPAWLRRTRRSQRVGTVHHARSLRLPHAVQQAGSARSGGRSGLRSSWHARARSPSRRRRRTCRGSGRSNGIDTILVANEPVPPATTAPPDERTPSPTAQPVYGEHPNYVLPIYEVVGFNVAPQRVRPLLLRRRISIHAVVDPPQPERQLGDRQRSVQHQPARASLPGIDVLRLRAIRGPRLLEVARLYVRRQRMWEIAGETTPPSRNDIINTGLGGSFVGEALFRLASLVLEQESVAVLWRELGAAAISPSTGFNRLAFGERFRGVFASHEPVNYSRCSLGFTGTAQNTSGTSTTKLAAQRSARRLLDRLRVARQAGIHVHAPVRLLHVPGDGVERQRLREPHDARIARRQGLRQRGPDIAASGACTAATTTSRRRRFA